MKPLIAAVVFLSALGCAKPAEHLALAGPAALPETWKLAKSEKYEISIGFPAGWRDGPLLILGSLGQNDPGVASLTTPAPSDDKVVQGLKILAKNAVENEKTALQAEWDRQGILMLISDGSRTLPGEAPNQYVLKHKTLSGSASLETAGEIASADLEFPHGPVMINTPMGKAIKFTSNYTTKGGDSIHMIAVGFADGNEAYALKFSCTGDNIFKDVGDQAIQSLRIKPGIVFVAPEKG